MPKLTAMKTGTRIVSHAFDMRGAKPKHVEPLRQTSLPGSKDVFLGWSPGRRNNPSMADGRWPIH